ncbi:DUF305 domain-containing protein [Nonomuraea sp. NPDC048916]|uniref:DUF305 domain-containing protein n=1 Tax=Nonomuraea sp. NPDC048916 TaxID=3154232 RepID=UPI0033F4B658
MRESTIREHGGVTRRLVVLGLLLVVAACGVAEPASDPVNAEDVMFVQMMVQHHRQGIEIAGLGSARARTPELKTLAAAVEKTQQDEVEMMLRWLHGWDQPLTAASGSHDDHGGLPETDRERIKALRDSKTFERDLLNLMIEHQGVAARMAGAHLTAGANPEVERWAGQVEASRTEQVRLMRAMLTS